MDPTMLKALARQISKEKDLEPQLVKDAIERAILNASRKNLSQFRDAVATFNMDTGELVVSVTKTIVDNDTPAGRTEIKYKDAKKLLKDADIGVGDDVIVPVAPAEFGRIAAQSARQIVLQFLRDAERQKIYNEYKDRVGQVLTGIVQRFERRDVVVNIGKTEGILPLNEQPMGAKYRLNERIKVIVVKVELTPRGPQIVLSRRSPQLVVELFKQEVPEILDGTVQIVGIAREPGVRMKIAVKSTNPDVDPVGACVGMKGSRVQMVVRELENEKIDIVPWNPDTATFIANALNPAKIVEIELDERHKTARVTVAQGNLAIAIGRKGQNTKLAAKLTGFRLDVRSENEDELAYEEIQRRYLEDLLGQIGGMSQIGMEGLLRSNYNSVDKIAKVEPSKLLAFTGDDLEIARRLVSGAQDYLEALKQMEDERKADKDRDDDGAEGAGEAAAAESEEGDAESETEGEAEAESESESEETAAEDSAEAGAADEPAEAPGEAEPEEAEK